MAAGYGFLVLLVYLMQGRMLYLADVPGRELEATPDQSGMEYEDVWLQTEDGVDIHGWFIQGETSRVLLFFHGNAGNISHRLFSIRQFLNLGLSVFIIDYRGYGQSGGRVTEQGLYRDADAAWRYLTEERGIDGDEIVIFGRSLGGSVAANLAARFEPQALILESTFTSVPDAAQDIYPWLPARWLSRLRHATSEYVRDVQSPVLVVHSRDDEIIPYHHGEGVFDAANEPRTMLTLRGGHNEAIASDEANYLSGLRRFLTDIDDDYGAQELSTRSSANHASDDKGIESASPAIDPSLLVFQDASDKEQADLQEWLANQYLAGLEYPEAHIRSEIARIEPDMLAERLADSIDANRGPVLLTTPLFESPSDLCFNLFTDTLVRASVVHHGRGRHTGMIMARLRSVSSSENSSTDNIYIEITSAGEVRGVVDTHAGFFTIRQTPVAGLVVVSEMNQDKVYDRLRVN